MFGTRMSVGLLAITSACSSGSGGDGTSDSLSGGGGSASAGETEGTDTEDFEPEGELAEADALGPQGLRRLSLAELSATLQLVTGIGEDEVTTMLAVLPGDGSTPFDNDYGLQTPSAPLVEGMFSIAEAVADRVLDDPELRAEVLGCTPSGPADEACLRSFAERFGRRVLRRPLTSAELDEYAAFIAVGEAEGDFDVAAALVLEAILLDAQFLYRIEIGQPVADEPDLVRLDGFEMASRLSFLLWGRGPDDALLDKAAAGELETPAQIHDTALALVQHRRGLQQLQSIDRSSVV